MSWHRWSGFPGGFCLDCGCECAEEICMGECDGGPDPGHPDRICPRPEHHSGDCQEPGSNRCNPYFRPDLPDDRLINALIDHHVLGTLANAEVPGAAEALKDLEAVIAPPPRDVGRVLTIDWTLKS